MHSDALPIYTSHHVLHVANNLNTRAFFVWTATVFQTEVLAGLWQRSKLQARRLLCEVNEAGRPTCSVRGASILGNCRRSSRAQSVHTTRVHAGLRLRLRFKIGSDQFA